MKRQDRINEYKKLLAISGFIATTSLSGCALIKADCPIEEEHAHLYTSSEYDMKKYVISEELKSYDLVRSDEYITLTPEEREKLKAQEFYYNRWTTYYPLYRIDMNEDVINDHLHEEDTLEYEYLQIVKLPKTPARTLFYWTDEPDRKLSYTGKERIKHDSSYYTAYKITGSNKKYKYESTRLYSLDEIPEGFEYVDARCIEERTYIYDKEKIEKFKNGQKIKVK